MNYLNNLYIKDENGSVRYWNISIEGCTITTEYGKLFTNKPTKSSYNAIEKNVGKSNYISPNDQALVEMKAKVKLQKVYGYKSLDDLNIHELPTVQVTPNTVKVIPLELYKILLSKLTPTDANNNLKPMKALKFHEVKDKNYPRLGQYKLNGFRGVVRWETITEGEGLFAKTVEKAVMRTNEGHEYIVPHLTNQFIKCMFFNGEDYSLAYDGEIYIHSMLLSEIKRRLPIKTSRGTTRPSADPNELELWIFDLAICNSLQLERLETLNIKSNNFINSNNIKVLDYIYINNDEEATILRNAALDKGFEGCILRDPNAYYRFGSKTATMIKYKKWKHTECKIIDIIKSNEEIKNDKVRTHILFILKNDKNNDIFESVPEGNEEQRLEYLNNKHLYIGKLATIKFYERTKNDLPFQSNVEIVGREDIGDL